MSAKKEFVILKVEGSGNPVVNVDAATDFETEIQEWTTDHLWCSQVHDFNITGGNPLLTLLVSNTNIRADFQPYKSDSTDMKISKIDERGAFDDDLPYKFFIFVYQSNGATGSFSLNMLRMQDN